LREHGYPHLWPERDLEDVLANGFAIGMIQADAEVISFAEFICDVIRPRHVIELGSCCGGWFYVMDRLADSGIRISVDMPWDERDPKPCWPDHMLKQAVPGDPASRVHWIDGQIQDQQTWETVWRALMGTLVDLLYIDADHSREGTQLHFEMYRPFVRPGGFVAFHDVANGWACGEFYRELCRQYPHREFVAEPPSSVFGVGVVQLSAPADSWLGTK
jgi:cephalosporin hydroxylase